MGQPCEVRTDVARHEYGNLFGVPPVVLMGCMSMHHAKWASTQGRVTLLKLDGEALCLWVLLYLVSDYMSHLNRDPTFL
jgi:hypothetical protein